MSAAWIPDHSAIACFRENPEMFRIKYRLHLVPATPNDKMQAGSAIHAARNVLYEWRKVGPAALSNVAYTPEIVNAAVLAGRTYRGEAPGARDAAHVERIVRGYAARYATEPFEVVANEEYVEARIRAFGYPEDETRPLGIDFDYCGILDSAIRFPDGSEYVMDTKSTGAYLNDGWETAMRLSDQMTGYVALRRALRHRCDGYYVDGIHVSDYIPKPKKGQTEPSVPKVDLEADFVRIGPQPVSAWRVERWVRDMTYTLAQIAELERTRGVDTPWPVYQNWPYGKVDAYRDFYETPAELHAETAALFERRAWSPRDVAEGRAVK